METMQIVEVCGKAMVSVGNACLKRANKHRVLAPDLFHAKSTQPNLATFYSLQGGAGGSNWSTGLLCSCEEKNGVGGCGLCCKALCCSCCVYAEIAELQGANEGLFGQTVNGQGNYWSACCVGCCADFIPAAIGVPGLSCLVYAFQRQAVRRRYGIPDDFVMDVCCNCCCHCWAMHQTRVELAARGAQPVPAGANVSAGTQ